MKRVRPLEVLEKEERFLEKEIQDTEAKLEELNRKSTENYKAIQSHPDTLARVKRTQENRLLPFLGPFFFTYWTKTHQPKLIDFSWEREYITEEQCSYTYSLKFEDISHDPEVTTIQKVFAFPAPILLVQWEDFKNLSIKEIWDLTLNKYDQHPREAFVALLHLTFSSLSKKERPTEYIVPEFHRLFSKRLLEHK